MSLYLWINIAVVAVPLILSFERELKFYKNFPAFITSFLTAGIAYIWWDYVATARGDWSFNEIYITGIKILNLPLEEVLFFITVPFACIFIYETMSFYLPDKKIRANKILFNTIVVIFLLLAFYFREQDYTFTVLLFSALFLFISVNFFPRLLQSRNYYLFMIAVIIPFFVVNYILTSMPVVIYNQQAITGIRITTIPLEDFFYLFSMLSYYLLVYKLTGEIWAKRKISR